MSGLRDVGKGVGEIKIPRLAGYQVIGDSILSQVIHSLDGNQTETFPLCQKSLYVDQVISVIKKESCVIEKNVLLYLGTTDLSSKAFCPIKFKNKVKSLVKLLKENGVDRLLVSSIIPKIGMENDHAYYRNLEYANSSLFFAAGEVENAFFVPVFDHFVVSVNQREKGHRHKYFDNVGKMKFQPKLMVYQKMNGKGEVTPLSLNERGIHLFNRVVISYMSSLKYRSVYEVLHSSKDADLVAQCTSTPLGKKNSSVAKAHIVATCMNDILQEGEEKAFTGEEDLPCFVPVKIKNVEIDALVDEGCPHVLLDQSIYDTLVSENPELSKAEFPAQGVLRYQNAMGVKKTKPNKSVALEYSFGDDIFGKETFHIPCVIVKNLNAKMLLGRQWRRWFKVATDDKDKTIRLTNPNCGKVVNYDYTVRSRSHNEKSGVQWLNCTVDLSPNLETLCELNGSHEELEKRKREQLIEQAEARIVEVMLKQKHLDSETRTGLEKILLKSRAAFRDEVGKCNVYTHKFQVEGLTEMRCKNRPINRVIEAKMREVIREWREQGLIKPSTSPYRVALQPVEKKNGQYRPCGDFRKFNEFISMLNNEVSRIADLRVKFKGKRYFTKLDFLQSFLQISLDKDSQNYCAFVFDGVPYQFTRVPFGTKDSMPAFIKALQIVLEGTEEFCTSYVDDILIHSATLEEHIRHIAEILSRIEAAGFTLNIDKCNWIQEQVEFVGMNISEKGVEPIPEKVAGIREFPRPNTKRKLQSFLGMVNFYRHYIPKCADIEKPLYEITSPTAVYKWTEVHQNAFDLLKTLLCEATIQQFPDMDKPFYVVTDASSTGIAGAIYQLDDDGHVRPICFNSRTLSSAEKNYYTTEQELLAAIYTLKKNYYILVGAEVYLFTDHSSITLLRQHPFLSSRISRWLIYLENFNLKKSHIPGKDNVVADALSRYHRQMMDKSTTGYISMNHIKYVGLDNFMKRIEQLNDEQMKDVLVQQFLLQPSKVPKLKKGDDGRFLWRSYKDHTYRIYVPATLRSEVLKHYHGYYVHPGTWKMLNMIRRTYDWPGIVEDVSQYLRNCIECQVSKSRKRHLYGPMKSIKTTKPGEIVCVDFYGPLPQARGGCKMIVVVMDHFTKFTRLFAIKNATAAATIRSLQSFINDFGHSITTILSDNGPQFASNLWRNHWREKGIEARFTSYYTPQSNPVERVMSTIKEVLRMRCRAQQRKWVEYLKEIEHKVNHVIHKTTEAIPYELVTGKPGDTPNPSSIPVPAVSSLDAAKSVSHENAEKRAARFNETHELTELKEGDEVLVMTHCQSDKNAGYKANLDLVYEGPFKVIKKYRDNVYCLLDEGDSDPRHVIRKNIRELVLIK